MTKVHREAVRFAERRLRHPAHRPRGPRGGRRHLRRGARAHHARRRPRRRRQRRRCATPTRSSGCRRPRCRSTRRWRPCAACASASPALQDPPSDDICYATQNRQLAVKQMAPDCDLMLVVGSRNSSNSVRLVEVALEHGSRAGHLVDYADEIDEAWLDGRRRRSASPRAPRCPEMLVRDVLDLPGRARLRRRRSRSSPPRRACSSRCPTRSAATSRPATARTQRPCAMTRRSARRGRCTSDWPRDLAGAHLG